MIGCDPTDDEASSWTSELSWREPIAGCCDCNWPVLSHLDVLNMQTFSFEHQLQPQLVVKQSLQLFEKAVFELLSWSVSLLQQRAQESQQGSEVWIAIEKHLRCVPLAVEKCYPAV